MCESPLYVSSVVTAGKRYRYYVCPNANRGRGCTSLRVGADWLEAEIERLYIAEVGDIPDTTKETIAASDSRTRLAKLTEAIGAPEAQATMIEAMGGDASDIRATQAVHRRNANELGKQEPTPEITREIPTGETKGQAWARLDWHGRNALLRKDGYRLTADAVKASGQRSSWLPAGARSARLTTRAALQGAATICLMSKLCRSRPQAESRPPETGAGRRQRRRRLTLAGEAA